jgi:hypothetical protein
MDSHPHVDMRRLGVVILEYYDMELRLTRKDADDFRADPQSYMRRVLKGLGHVVNDVTISTDCIDANEVVQCRWRHAYYCSDEVRNLPNDSRGIPAYSNWVCEPVR